MQASLDKKSMTKNQSHEYQSKGLILGLESSGAHASVALISDGEVVSQLVRHERHGHASYFVDMAADCLAEAGFNFKDIRTIAAGIGPGSFTGLRTCLSAAKGFVLAGDLKGCGIDGLRARAFALQTHYKADGKDIPPIIIACADTRRGPYFWQAFDETLKPVSTIQEALAEDLPSQASALYSSFIIAMPVDAELETCRLPSCYLKMDMMAKDIALLALSDDIAGISPAPLDPLYVAQPKLGPSAA